MREELLQHCNICDSTLLKVLDADSNLAQCGSCGYIFDNPRPTTDELVAFYSRRGKYDGWLQELDARERMWRRRLSRLLPSKNPGTLLDVGTGIGQFLAVARQAYTEVYGTEISGSAIEIARDRYNLEVFHGTIEELAQQGRVFDNITLFHVLEHVHDPRQMLKTCHQLLSPHGVIAIAVPNEVNSLRVMVKRLLVRLGLKKNFSGKLGLPRIRLDGSISEIHLSHFTPKVLRRLLEASGFSLISNDVDPYRPPTDRRNFKQDLYYKFCSTFLRLSSVNLYDAMLMIARKES